MLTRNSTSKGEPSEVLAGAVNDPATACPPEAPLHVTLPWNSGSSET